MPEATLDKNDVIDLAMKRAKLAEEATQLQRTREQDDLQFQIPENQWTDGDRNARKATTFQVGGRTIQLPQRPLIAIPKLDQPVQLILNQERAAHLGVTINALSEDADDDTAEILQGLYRRIETDSRADLARTWAFERSTKCGLGAYRILTEYCANDEDFAPDDPAAWDQKIVIKRILYQESVRWDPFATEPDNSDAEWAFIFEDVPVARYQREHEHSALAAMSLEELRGVGEDAPGWINGDDDVSMTIRIAEYFRFETKRKTLNGPDKRTRTIDVKTLKWSTINAVEELGEAVTLPGKYIPIVTVVGRELIPMAGKRAWYGVYSSAKDLQRLYNHQATGVVEAINSLSKSPYIMAEGQDEGYEDMWAQLAVRAFPALIYRPTTVAGAAVAPPQRNMGDLSVIQSLMIGLQQTNSDIQASTATFDPSLGNLTPKERSGKAILAQQQQADASNSHYLDNLARISLSYEAKVILDLIPHVYDRPGRVERTLGEDDNEGELVMLNQPFTSQDGQPKAFDPQMPGQTHGAAANGPKPKHYDLKKGRYGVVASVGKSYPTRLQQGNDQLGQLLQAEPQLVQVLGDIWMNFQEWPGHKEAAKRLKKMLPPQLQDRPEGEPDPQQLQQQLQQAGQMLQMLTKELEAKTKAIEEDAVKQQGETERAQMDHSAEMAKSQLDADTKLEIERMRNETQLALAEMKIQAGMATEVFNAEQERVGMGHDAAMTQLGQDHEREQAASAADQSTQQAERGHEQAMEAGEVGHRQTLEQQEQAAALAPKPEETA